MNIQDMIDQEKQKFFTAIKEPELFFKYNDQFSPHYITPLLISLIFSGFSGVSLIFSLIFFNPFSFVFNDGFYLFVCVLLTLIALFISTLVSSIMLVNKYIKFKYKHLKKRDDKFNQFITKNLQSFFFDQQISEEIKNKIKIDFSMSEYKAIHSLAEDPSKITYKDLTQFLNKREEYNRINKDIENDKLNITLTSEEISQYQNSTV